MGVKAPLTVFLCTNMQALMEGAMYVSQGDIKMFLGDAWCYMELYPATDITSRSDQPLGASA